MIKKDGKILISPGRPPGPVLVHLANGGAESDVHPALRVGDEVRVQPHLVWEIDGVLDVVTVIVFWLRA